MACDATLAPPRVLLASVSPVSLYMVLGCLATGLGLIIVMRVRREEQREEEQESLTEQQSRY